jgi:hypothetical protein
MKPSIAARPITTLLGIALLALHTGARADLSFTGTFAEDDDVQTFPFTVVAPSDVTLRTLSYAGGTNANAQVIPRGGFDPILSLFDGSGALIAANDDGTFPDVGLDLVTGQTLDAFLRLPLAAGNYTVAITQNDNFAAGPALGNGFTRQGQGNFTGTLFGPGSGSFFDFTGDQRTNTFAVDVLSAAAPVPEPSSVALVAGALLILGGWRLKPAVDRRERCSAALRRSFADGFSKPIREVPCLVAVCIDREV